MVVVLVGLAVVDLSGMLFVFVVAVAAAVVGKLVESVAVVEALAVTVVWKELFVLSTTDHCWHYFLTRFLQHSSVL